MIFIERFKAFIDDNLSINILVRILLIACIFFIFYLTSSFWYTSLHMAWNIGRPFIFGFVIAYVLAPGICFLESKKINKNFSIPLVFIILLGGFVIFFIMAIPMMYNRVMDFFNTIYINLDYITNAVTSIDNPQLLAFVNNMIEQISLSIDSSYREFVLLALSSNVSHVVKIFMDVLTLSFFTIIISIYMLTDFTKIKNQMRSASVFINKQAPCYLSGIDDDMQIYLKSILVLMSIKFVEYSALYYLLGHRDFWLLGILTALGLLIPYFGATIANTIGVLTILHMGFGKVVILLLAILVLSNLDAYFIAPSIHAKRSTLSPLWILFSIFTGGYLGGTLGILVAVPMLIAIKSMINTNGRIQKNV